ncbi:hypothetical protein FGE12_13575 [Aggregicoccus sp. 17bor-14]|uniref:hypothetical protein n=1 Tax=Myxococcaceae TaxID=31 RepID=UPI00129CA177|nr:MULTISPECIES: hypothetical protein [Myxococcaceae]MBF5043422.1 hypothetical protein [Simulacricoccus sp. 17bor-14]MRI89180.1 hypothetical protein [Aggregicoccus sp. 17bor-14]
MLRAPSIVALWLLASACAGHPPSPSSAGASGLPSADALLREVDRDGAQQVVTRLWNAPGQWESLCARVQSGAAAWIEVARRLRPGTDAGPSEDLAISLALALPEAPENVLHLVVGDLLPLETVCTPPHLEPASGVAERWTERALKALGQVEAPALRERRDACRAMLLQQLHPQAQ